MHTLAAILADAGQVEEAREPLLELLELRNDKRPVAIDWFVVGRIAENHDDVESARSAPLKGGISIFGPPLGTQTIARNRLRTLGAQWQPSEVAEIPVPSTRPGAHDSVNSLRLRRAASSLAASGTRLS